MYNSDSSSSSPSPPYLQQQATSVHGQQQALPNVIGTTTPAVPVTPYLSQVCNYGPIFASPAYAHHNYSPFHGYDRYINTYRVSIISMTSKIVKLIFCVILIKYFCKYS